MPSKRYLAIPGSRREAMPGTIRTGPSNPKERLQGTVVLRQRPSSRRLKTPATCRPWRAVDASRIRGALRGSSQRCGKGQGVRRRAQTQSLQGEYWRKNGNPLGEGRRFLPRFSGDPGTLAAFCLIIAWQPTMPIGSASDSTILHSGQQFGELTRDP